LGYGLIAHLLTDIPKAHAEQIMSSLAIDYPKPRSWRIVPRTISSNRVLPPTAAHGDKYDQVMLKVQSTRIHGPGVTEMLELAADYQRAQDKEVSNI
jgi:hypothetical protein